MLAGRGGKASIISAKRFDRRIRAAVPARAASRRSRSDDVFISICIYVLAGRRGGCPRQISPFNCLLNLFLPKGARKVQKSFAAVPAGDSTSSDFEPLMDADERCFESGSSIARHKRVLSGVFRADFPGFASMSEEERLELRSHTSRRRIKSTAT